MQPGRLFSYRPRLSFANVTALLALFIALGGTSYAVTQLPRNSVGAPQLKAGAVTSAKIRDGAITPADLAPEASQAGPRGPRGPIGPSGRDGSAGPQGPAGPSDLVVRRRDGRATLGLAISSIVDVITLPIPTAGKWLLRTETQVGWFPSVSAADFFDCRYIIGGLIEPAGRQKGVLVGSRPDATQLAQMTHTATVEAAGPLSVTFRCNHISDNLPAGGTPPFFERTVATAQRVENLDYAEVSG